jgi:hypothetical protein
MDLNLREQWWLKILYEVRNCDMLLSLCIYIYILVYIKSHAYGVNIEGILD